jgi:hypothetical protein
MTSFSRARSLAFHSAIALAVALPVALWRTEAHVVPSAHGLWRGLAGAPDVRRVLIALASGALVAWALRREPPHARRPLLALALAGAPLVALAGGHALGLLGFQRPALALIVAASVAVAALRVAATRLARRPAPHEGAPTAAPGWRRELALVALGFGFFALLGRYLPGPAGAQGDEPHYLLIAHSLLGDGDVDLADEYDQREYRPFFGGTLQAHTSPASPRGVLYEVHTPGLPALLLPAYALGGYAGAKLFIALMAAFTAALVHRLARETTGSARLALGVWTALVAVPPLPVYAQAIYPESAAALATAVFLLTSRRDAGWGTLLAAGFAAAWLPWLHPKFLPLALVGLALGVARPSPSRRAWPARGTAVLLFAASLAALLVFLHALYGRASLSAAYGPRFASDVSLARVPWGLPALFFDRQFGLCVVAPLWALALPGFAALARGRLGDTLRALLLAGATLGVGASFSMWWGGACPPGRFVVPALPALALALAPAFRRRRDAAVALLAAGSAVVLLAAGAPRALHNRADGQSGLLRFLVPSLDLDGSLPSFVVGGPEAFVLALTLSAVVALAWARGLRGLVVGALAYALVSGALRSSPLVDERTSVLRLIDAWDAERIVPVTGPLELSSLSLPLDLPRAPWTLRRGDVRRTRRVALPAGLYRLDVAARPGDARSAVDLARLETRSDDLGLDWVYLRTDRPLQPLVLLLPGGAPRLILVASGVADESIVEGARLTPLALVPRRLREVFRFPALPDREHYRVGHGDAALRVTAVDRSEPEGDGFRLEGEWGQFLVETPPGAAIRVRVRRERPAPGDALWWNEHEVALPAESDVTLERPNEGGVRLGDVDVLPVWLRAEGAWIAFDSPRAGVRDEALEARPR